jgi:hypothetical protein
VSENKGHSIGFGQPMLNPVGFANHVGADHSGIDGVAVPRLLCELNAIRHTGGAGTGDAVRRQRTSKELSGSTKPGNSNFPFSRSSLTR